MRIKIILPALLAILVIMISLWALAGTYPHTIYEYRETGNTVTQYEDRVGGYAIEAVPVFIPNNPLWVDLIRSSASIFIMIVLFISILYCAVSLIEGRNKVKANVS